MTVLSGSYHIVFYYKKYFMIVLFYLNLFCFIFIFFYILLYYIISYVSNTSIHSVDPIIPDSSASQAQNIMLLLGRQPTKLLVLYKVH